MTKEITKAFILQQIQDKFGLREYEAAKFLFEESVVPVYNIDRHLGLPMSRLVQISITETGGIEFYKVDDDQIWTLHRYVVVPMGAGAFTMAGVYLTRTNNAAYFIYLDLTAGQTAAYANDLPKPARLYPGDTININIDGYTSTQSLRLYIDYTREMIR